MFIKTNGSGRRLKTLNQVKQLALQNDGECFKSYNYTNEKLIFSVSSTSWKVPSLFDLEHGVTCRRSKIDLGFYKSGAYKNGDVFQTN